MSARACLAIVVVGALAAPAAAAPQPATPPAILTTYDAAAILQAWQGTWNLGDAIEIRGDHFHSWSPSEEDEGTVAVLAPCELQANAMTPFFTLDGKLHAGDGGFVRGRAAVVCAPDPYVLDELGICHRWSRAPGGGWQVEMTLCFFVTGRGGERAFVIDDFLLDGMPKALAVRGDVVYQRLALHTPTDRYPDLAAAARASLSTPNVEDQLSLHQASFLDTVPAVFAWRALGRRVDGEHVELTASLARVGPHSCDLADALWSGEKAPPPGQHPHTIACPAPPPAGLAVGDKVVATGTLRVRGSTVELHGCAVRAP